MDITFADQDSDFGYTTNHPAIVEHARKCYLNYPTIVNNIPKEKNTYKNTMSDYALIDNNLAKSQTDIGESSNLAHIAQSYACTFPDIKEFNDYVCILSVIAQVAIDSSKRRFDTDIASEIKRIRNLMNISEYKYPAFWKTIKRGFNSNNINKNLICPMNYLAEFESVKTRSATSTLPMSHFFIKHKLEKDRKQCKKVEELIEKYSFDLFKYNTDDDQSDENYILLRSDFDNLVRDIQSVYISSTYTGLFSWLLDRAFVITDQTKRQSKSLKNTTNTNKAMLMKVLYDVNKKSFLKCFKAQ